MNNYQIERISEYGDLILKPSLKRLTTIAIGGRAKALFFPHSILTLQAMISFCRAEGIAWVIFGNGSNILANDEYYDGIIIKLTRHLNAVYRIGEYAFEIEAGASLIAMAHKARQLGLSGLEWAAGIPATIGGATYMNAGAYKRSMSDVITEVCVLKDEAIQWITNEACAFAYRTSIFKEQPNWPILAIRVQLEPGNSDEISLLMQDRQQRRINSQPLESPSFGSTFRNPNGNFAWQLIEDCQLRGYQIGEAKVSDKHTNFLINIGNARFQDMIELIHTIQEEVLRKHQQTLTLEVEIFNWPNVNQTQ